MNGSALPIEDYALVGDCRTGALVGRNGSIDWLCWPRFDSDACFASLLGTARNGRWLLAPASPDPRVTRAYRGETMVLETSFDTEEGQVAIIDFMPIGKDSSSIVRRVEGRRAQVAMRMELVLRFGYGASTPWVTRLDGGGGITGIVGPDLVALRTQAALRGEDNATVAEFTIREGESVDFVLSWGPSHLPPPAAFSAADALAQTEAHWRAWSARCSYRGRWRAPVLRSLLTLKALTYAPTGGIVAALTTSLPEQLGGTRNWDYRYCWLRDATLTLIALMAAGYHDEAAAWRQWLHRAVAGNADDLQIMYGVGGERRLIEWTPDWLSGYQGASPVRIGNAASEQLQLDVYGEVMDAMHLARESGLDEPASSWSLQAQAVEHLSGIWNDPDDGIWEIRGERRHFTHSKMMAWVALDRAVRDAERFGFAAPLDRWRGLRDRMHVEICAKGFDASRNSFTQSFGDPELDASLLLMPQVGFLPAADPRVLGTVQAIERELVQDGFVLRYRSESGADGLPPGDGAFLPCSFWLADTYAMQGRTEEAERLFSALLSLCNDVGLLSEEYDPRTKRLIGNVPQAFSHLALIGTAFNLSGSGPAQRRSKGARARG